jgi:DNA polymerase III epsilon subunit family exonuclease
MTRRIAIDIETTGLDPESGDGIILICARELLNDRQIGSTFQTLIKPPRSLIPIAAELTGITNEMLAMAPSFAEIADEFLDFIADAELVFINAPFEVAFLNRALADSQNPTIPQERVMNLSNKIPREFRKQGSDGIFNFAGIEPNPLSQPSEEVARVYWALVDPVQGRRV